MCYYWQVTRFICGHEEIAPASEQGSFCLFGQTGGICGRELGRYRILDVLVNGWCRRCAPVAAGMARYKSQYRASAPAPHAQAHEAQKQRAARERLGRQAGVPPGASSGARLALLNDVARRNLRGYLLRGDAYAPGALAWVLWYVASLPPWLDRAALVAEMRPWFAELLDEDQQICLHPALQGMRCEGALDDVMVWRKD